MDVLTERSREIPWLLGHAIGTRNLLDIGSAGAKYIDALSQVAHIVTAIDTRPFSVPYGVYGSVMDASDLAPEWTSHFDVVSCISVLDHVGLDAYGNVDDPTLLDKVVSEIARVTMQGGKLLVTAPVGRPQVTTHPGGGQRVFGVEEFANLFSKDWRIMSSAGWIAEGDSYRTVADVDEISDAEYLGIRAGACIALELVRV